MLQSSAWREGLHPRERKGTEKGGQFAPKTGGTAVASRPSPGPRVHVANLTPEQRQANLDSLKAAKSKPVDAPNFLERAPAKPGAPSRQEYATKVAKEGGGMLLRKPPAN